MQIPLAEQMVVADSEEPFIRRIYSYDMAIDSTGRLHIVYAVPATSGNTNRCVIYYAFGSTKELESNKMILCDDGKLGSVSTFVRVDTNDDVHICYIQYQEDPDTALYYQKIASTGYVYKVERVEAGGWHTKMAIDENNKPMFMRDSLFYPRLLRHDGVSWKVTDIMLTTPATAYRLCEFEFDPIRGKYHITFGDKIVLSSRCPWGVSECAGTYFSKYHYAYSTDGVLWEESTVSDLAHLWDYEYWTALILDTNGRPYTCVLDMNPEYLEYPPNLRLLWGVFTNESWETHYIAGTNCVGTDAAGGMGARLAIDKNGRFWGAWDNSPAKACNGLPPSDAGNTVLGYSADGQNWNEIQVANAFSAEGYCIVRIHGQCLYLLELGDHTDAKLYLNKYNLNNLSVLSNCVPIVGDFDGDRKAGCGVYYAPAGYWQLVRTSAGLWENHFGFEGTEPITGDFDGDGIMDFGCYFPPNGGWFIFKSRDGFWVNNFGYDGTSPIRGDFDGDKIDDFGCYFPPDGSWFIYKSHDGFWVNNFGYEGTSPITGDFDGDGIDDFGCYFPPDGSWFIYKSRDGFWVNKFGFEGTLPITGDFDGDGIGDFGCYFPPDGTWFIYKSRDGFWTNQFGFEGTLPVVADFDGDGQDDFGCFYPGSGEWFLYCSTDGFRTEQTVVY